MSDKVEPIIHGYISVPVLFRAKWRFAADMEILREEIVNHRTSDRLTTPPPSFADMPEDLAELAEFKKTSPHIFRMWVTLERKLDYLIQLTTQSPAYKQDMEECVCTAVSEGGVRLRIKNPTPLEGVIFVSLSFPSYPLLMIDALIHITECVPRQETEGEWNITARYDSINNIDLEDVIQYVFKRQREMIQMERE
jgi:hypothetical protein